METDCGRGSTTGMAHQGSPMQSPHKADASEHCSFVSYQFLNNFHYLF